MDKRQLYAVAGHTFSLTMRESEFIWYNTQPSRDVFIENHSNQPLFNLILKEEITDITFTPNYIDNNSKPEDSKQKVYLTDSGYMFEIIAAFTNRKRH